MKTMLPTGRTTWLFLISMLPAILPGCSGPDPGPPIETPGTTDRTSQLLGRVANRGYLPENSNRPFDLALEQDGKRLVLDGPAVFLARRPFDLLLTFYNKHGLLLDFSFSPKLFEMARSGASLAEPFQAGTGMAEHPGNPDQEAVVADDMQTHHYLFYEPHSGEHRCDRARRVGGGYLCRRRVARLLIRAKNKTIPLEQLPQKTIYIVIYQATGWQAGSPELKRQALKLNFRSP